MQKHMTFLIEKGGMYLTNNQHVLFHGCIPVDEKGQLLAFELDQSYRGKELLGFFEKQITESAKDLTAKEDLATDLIWYAWSGPFSPLFGKSKMATFERYFLTEPHTHVEKAIPIITCEMKSGSVKKFWQNSMQKKKVQQSSMDTHQ